MGRAAGSALSRLNKHSIHRAPRNSKREEIPFRRPTPGTSNPPASLTPPPGTPPYWGKTLEFGLCFNADW